MIAGKLIVEEAALGEKIAEEGFVYGMRFDEVAGEGMFAAELDSDLVVWAEYS